MVISISNGLSQSWSKWWLQTGSVRWWGQSWGNLQNTSIGFTFLFRWECPGTSPGWDGELHTGWSISVHHGTLWESFTVLRQHSCPSHPVIESIMAHYIPSAEMITKCPQGRGRGGGAPQPSGLCKGGQLTVRSGTVISTGSLSYLTPSPSFTFSLIRSEVSHHTHKSSPPPFQQSTLASPQTGKCFESLSPKSSVSQPYNEGAQVSPKLLSFTAMHICCLFLCFPCSQWIPASFKSPASTGTVEKALIVKELLLYDPWGFSGSKGNCSQVSTCRMQPLDTEQRCKKYEFHQLWFFVRCHWACA